MTESFGGKTIEKDVAKVVNNLNFVLNFIAVFLDSPTEFTVDSRAVPKKPGDGPGKVTCLVHNPSGSFSEPVITSQPDGQNRVAYTPFEEGKRKHNYNLPKLKYDI